jgi:hypothetical protein
MNLEISLLMAYPTVSTKFELVDSGESARAEEAGIAEDPEASEYELGTIKIEKEAGAR